MKYFEKITMRNIRLLICALILVCFMCSVLNFKVNYVERAIAFYYWAYDENALSVYYPIPEGANILDYPRFGMAGPIDYGFLEEAYVSIFPKDKFTGEVRKILKEKFYVGPWVVIEGNNMLWE